MIAAFTSRAAIAGYGATEFSKCSGRSELQLAMEAILAALKDADIDATEVDGFATYTMDNNNEHEIFRLLGSREMRFFARTTGGGGAACGPLQQAMLAVSAGIADTIVCYRAMNERSEYRFGVPMAPSAPTSANLLFGFLGAQGLRTPAALIAMTMRRYMHETGATEDDFATIAISARKHAATNPNAFFYGKPITREEYFAAPMIADPLRLLDCCQESDGAVAIVVTSVERAATRGRRPIRIKAAAQGLPKGSFGLGSYWREDIIPREGAIVARQLYAQAGIGPKDINVAILYDHFAPTVLPSLEAYGFCAPGEAKEFIKDGNIEIGGGLPVNPHGGLLAEAYIHGLNGVGEAVRQLRGTAANQHPHVVNVLVTGASAVPTTGVILGLD